MATRRSVEVIFVTAVTLLAAWLRLRQLAVPSFWLDESLHYDFATRALSQPFWRWLGIFQIENGPLFYTSEVAGRLSHSPEWSARIAPALFGIATIPLAWFAARAITDRAVPYAFAVLLAVSPLHVYYSREARPYALVVLISTALLALLLRGGKRIGVVIVLVVTAFYSTAVVAPVLLSAAVATMILRWWRIAAASIAGTILIVLCYRPIVHIGEEQLPRIDSLLQSFSIAALDITRPHRGAYVFALLAIAGAIALARRNATQAIVAVAIAVLPVVIPIIAARRMQHFFAVRYVIAALPAYLLLVAVGISTLLAPLRRWHLETIASIVAAALLVREGWDAALNEPFRKLDWRTVARSITQHAHANDAVIAANDWSAASLAFYLRGLSPPVRLFNANESRTMGEVFAYQNTTSWIVIAGYSAHEFADWACRFPVALASPL